MAKPHQGEPLSREMSGGDDRRLDFRPGMGMWWEITRSTEDTSGELFEGTNWAEPRMPGPPIHVHPTADESYELIEGEREPARRRSCLRGCRIRFANATDELAPDCQHP
jgi:hypothetical protein